MVEALLFASEAPLSAAELARADESLDEEVVESAVAELRGEYDQDERAFQIFEVGGGYQLLTRPEFAPVLERFDSVPATQRLSGPALETLAILAYRQPVGRADGGEEGWARRRLKRAAAGSCGTIEVWAGARGGGRPLLYREPPPFFLQHFGFRSLDDLPPPRRPSRGARTPRDRPDPSSRSPMPARALDSIFAGAERCACRPSSPTPASRRAARPRS